MNDKIRLSLYKLIGKGYANGWWRNFKGRYRAWKGGRNTKKSYNLIGYEILDKILSDPRRNVLILRETNASHKTTTFSTLLRIINQPDINQPEISFNSYFQVSKSDFTITYIPTGQVILFRGMDDPQKLQGIQVTKGYLTDVYVEEAFEIKDYEKWRVVDGSIRGVLPDGLFHQITFLMNAWDMGHWIYDKFFKGRLEDDVSYLESHSYQDYKDENIIIERGRGLYLCTNNYKVNEFRDPIVDEVAKHMKEVAPEIYKVEYLGCWGNSTEAVYPEFTDALIRPRDEINNMAYANYAIGIDTGLSNGEGKVKKGEDVKIRSATTMQLVGLTMDYSKLCCINEFYWSNEQQQEKKTEPQLMADIVKTIIEWKNLYAQHYDLMKGMINVYVDCADIGFRQGLELEARKQRLYNVQFIPSTKIKIQTRVDFVRWLMAFGEFLVSEACPNLTRELKNSRRGAKGECREDIDDHAINANEYGWAPLTTKLKRWKTFKPR